MSNLPGNRMSTPEASHTSTLRPPSSRTMPGGNAHLRASADMTGLTGTSPSSRIRPSSDFYGQSQPTGGPSGSGSGSSGLGAGAGGSSDLDPQDKLAQEWIADIDQYETTLEEMAAATLDQDFKDELSAIEQWFRVLSEAERTAALYALLQQTTQVQIRFFIQVLRQMGQKHPMCGVLSPANFDKDPMSNRLSDAMNKLSVESARNSMARNSMMSVKRQSGLDPSTINAMFPDAAAAIATEKAKFTQQTGTLPVSNRNSAVDPRNSLVLTPTISTPADAGAAAGAGAGSGTGSGAGTGTGAVPASSQIPTSPWGANSANSNNSNSNAAGSGAQQQQSVASPPSQPPMGQFVQPPPSAGGLRSPLPSGAQAQNADIAAKNTSTKSPTELPLFSPYGATSGNWASMVNTPMVANFNQQQGGNNQADMVANATAMKLAALSTVNNRVFLDDVRKYRRTRSSDGPGAQQGGQQQQGQSSPGAPTINLPGNMVMVNEAGQVVRGDSMLSIPGQTPMGFGAHRSRPNSPGIALQSATGFGSMPFSSPQTAGFLSAYDGAMSNQMNLGAMNLGQLSGGMGNIGMGSIGMGMGGIGIGGLGGLGSATLNPHSHHQHEGYLSDHSDITRGRSPRGRRGSSKPPEDPTDPSLLQDIPSWLRSLRLHKYTDNLKDMKWTDLVELDDKQLEERGVNALGARRKMLKVFEQVKEAKAEGKL